MEYNLVEIKTEITNNCKKIFDNSVNPSYHNFDRHFDFDSGLDIFFQLILFKTNIYKLDGLPKTILVALQEALVTRKGDLNSLKILIEELEPFLKKLAYLDSNFADDFSNDHSKTLLNLFKHLNLNQDLKSNAVFYSEANLPSFKSQPEFQYYLCSSWLIRNQVHNSPNWDFVEVATNLRDTIVVYLYASFKYFSSLKQKVLNVPLPNRTTIEIRSNLFDDPKVKPLYDFISFNHETYEIRTEIVKSYILHFLSNKSSKTKIDEIRQSCNSQFKTNTDKNFYERTLRELKLLKKINITGINDDEYELTLEETNRIKGVKEFFLFQKEMFFYEITEVLKKYALVDHIDEVIRNLTQLFERNYNIDLQEIVEKGLEADDNVFNLNQFTKFLKTLISGKAQVELLKDLIIVCGGNDFLHRITASQAFAHAANPTEIEQYIRQQQRIIYIDTNVLLYGLCYWYEDSKRYDNLYYKVAKELIKFAEDHDNVSLKTSQLYLYEVAYQLKEALLLVPFESIGLFERVSSSNNIFYKFYIHLKEEYLLDENIRDFADFLDQFGVTTDSLIDKQFLHKTSEIIGRIIEGGNVNIEIVTLPNYSFEGAFEEFKNSLKYPRPSETISNDAKMICHLSDKDFHLNEPIFTTWDTIFFETRKKYLKKNRNSKSWHLFTPSKLINHLQLLEFRINAESVTNDFLTIVDSINIKEKTRHTLDVISELLDINQEERRRYINKLQEFHSKYVFNIEEKSEEPSDDIVENKPVEKLLVELNKHYADRNVKYSFNDFKAIFDNKLYFDSVVEIFQVELEYYLKNRKFSEQLFSSIDALIIGLRGDKK